MIINFPSVVMIGGKVEGNGSGQRLMLQRAGASAKHLESVLLGSYMNEC